MTSYNLFFILKGPDGPKKSRRPSSRPGSGGHANDDDDDDYTVVGVVTEPYNDPSDPNNDPPGISFGNHQPTR